MADVTLQVHYITSGYGSGSFYLTGQYIRVIADGSAIRAELWDAPEGGSLIGTPSGGLELGIGILVSSGTFNNYQYCSSSDLVSYTPINDWPYAQYNLTTDHPSCAIVVCDLEITSATVTNESTDGAADGEIALTSTSSNGTVKYSLIDDFDYTTEGVSSPITGLSTGNYIVYAKDSSGCVDQVSVFVDVDFTYGPRWRAEYDCVHPRGYKSRIDIEERDYVGAVTEVCCGAKPFELEYHPSDDSQITPSSATIELAVETEDMFEDIRIGYDRQFLLKKYKDITGTGSSFELEWVGYIVTEFYEEPYIFEPYIITIKAIDGLGELQNKDFLAMSGDEYFGNMSILQIITECLKKLPFQLNIRSCVNIFETNMDQTVTDDPLNQTFIRAENFRGKKCDYVLTSLLSPFVRAELFQSLGVYWVRTKEQSIDTTLNYREFDKDGIFVDNDSIAARKNLDFPSGSSRMQWVERSQVLRFSRNYGAFQIIHNLDKDNNMTDSGGFELSDIDPATEFFRNWQIFPAQTNVISGLEYTSNDNSKSAFFFQWAPTSDNQANNILSTNLMPWSITGNVFENKGTNFNLKFQVYAAPSIGNVPWIWLGWKLRFTDTDTNEFYDWNIPSPEYVPLAISPTANVAKINDIYITQYNSFQNFEFKGFMPPGDINAVNFTIQLSFYFHNHKGRDFASFALLRDYVTVGLNQDTDPPKRVYVASGGLTYGMELQYNTDAESEPDIVRPDDYHATTNPYQWVNIVVYDADSTLPLMGRILIDNVEISMYEIAPPEQDVPGFGLIDPPETIVYEQVVSDLNESVFSVTVDNGDAPDMPGSEYIYNGFFMLSDGTKTSRWGRLGVTEERLLLDIYLGHLVSQGSQSLRLLNGSGLADIQIGYINSLEDQRDNVRYRFTRFSFNDLRGIYDFEMEETKTGDDGESPPEELALDYTLDFEI